MRSSTFAVFALAGWASAQNFGAEPSCAIPCLSSAISIAGCDISDEGCQCGTAISVIQSAITPCLLSACNQVDLQSAASVGFALCSSYSASLTSASATTTSPSLLSAAVTSTSSIPVSTRSVIAITTSVPATTSAPSSSNKSGSSSAASLASSSSSSSGSAAPASTNAAPSVMAGVGGLIGVAAAFVAAL